MLVTNSSFSEGIEHPPYRQGNDELSWLWEASTAFFPGAYLSSHDAAADSRFWQSVSHETWRVWNAIPRGAVGHGQAILPFGWYDIDDAGSVNFTEHLSAAMVNDTFGSAARQGMDGTHSSQPFA